MTKADLYILMLEDDPLDAELNKAQLFLLEEYNCSVKWVASKESYLEVISNSTPDIVLSDFNLPQYNGIEALNDLKKKHPLTPFIFVTGAIDEETAVETIKAGAWDYVVKDRLFRLPLAIRGALLLKEERTHTARAEAKKRQLSKAIEQSPVHIVICNKENTVEYVNHKFTEVTGYEPSEIIGENLNILIPPHLKVKYYQTFDDLSKSNEGWKGESQSLRKDGTVFWEYQYISPLKNDNGETTHFVIIKEDITRRKQMEQELIETRDRALRSDKLKEAFLQNLSHEIRTPLNAIVGFSELLSLDSNQTPEQKEYTSIIMNSSNQLLSIVNDILTVARIQTGQEAVVVKQTYINSLLDNLFKIFKSQTEHKSLELIVAKENEKPEFSIITDETKLTQILSNLINNAIKFTDKGKIEFGYTTKEKQIEFFVNDTGIGIPKDFQEIIFERFRQVESSLNRNFGGTGLGLSISKSFAEMLGGSIRIESVPLQGSQFYLSIPLIEAVKETALPTKPALQSNDTYTILVAEDEQYNFQLIEAYFLNSNFITIHARNGQEAIEYCLSNTKLDIVLMDIKMPKIDGITAMKEIRKQNCKIPIIAQTAYALESEKQDLLEMGFDDYIAKPIKKDDLFQIVLKNLK